MEDAQKLVRLAEEKGSQAAEAVRSLVRMGHDALGAVVDSIRRNDATAGGNLRYALAQMRDPRSLPELTSFLNEESMPLVMAAFRALGRSRDPSVRHALTSYLMDQDKRPTRRSLAAGALGELRDQGAIPSLLSAVQEAAAKGSRELALACVIALAKLGNHDRADVAISLAGYKRDTAVRSMAAEALHYAVGPGAADALKKGLRDKDAEVRRKAIDGLFYLGTKEMVTPLVDAVSNRDPNVATAARARACDLIGVEYDDDLTAKQLSTHWKKIEGTIAGGVVLKDGKPRSVPDMVSDLNKANEFRVRLRDLYVISGEDFGYDLTVPEDMQVKDRPHVIRDAIAWAQLAQARFTPGVLYRFGFAQDVQRAIEPMDT
jgi:HEAT repeat protein